MSVDNNIPYGWVEDKLVNNLESVIDYRGKTPNGNANFGWMQHMLYHLSPKGVMATVLSNGSLSSNTSGKGKIRENLVENNLVECIVACSETDEYEDIKGFCKSATHEEIQKHSHVLTPGRYVGIPDEEDDGIPFKDKMADLTTTLKQQMDKEAELNKEIKTQLSKIGFSL